MVNIEHVITLMLENRSLGLTQHQALADAVQDLPLREHSREGVSRSVLTRREEQVVSLPAGGLSNRQIAKELMISEATAAKHVEHIREKLGMWSALRLSHGGRRSPRLLRSRLEARNDANR